MLKLRANEMRGFLSVINGSVFVGKLKAFLMPTFFSLENMTLPLKCEVESCHNCQAGLTGAAECHENRVAEFY